MKTDHNDKKSGVIEVTGNGEVKVKPDVAHVGLAVITDGKTAKDAASFNPERANMVIAAVRKLGVSERDIETTGLRVSPIYRFDNETGTHSIVGYRAQNSVNVDTELDLASNVFDSGIGAGANESSGISFGLRDEHAFRGMALEAAIKGAQKDAGVIGRTMNLELLGPSEIEVAPNGPPVIMRSELRANNAGVQTPVFPGEITVSAQVRVKYRYHR